MRQVIDYKLVDGKAADDLAIGGGDFQTAESTQEHQRQLLLNDKGEFKENPTICVGLLNYLDDDINDLPRDINTAFTQDGMTVNSVQIVNGQLTVNANY